MHMRFGKTDEINALETFEKFTILKFITYLTRVIALYIPGTKFQYVCHGYGSNEEVIWVSTRKNFQNLKDKILTTL